MNSNDNQILSAAHLNSNDGWVKYSSTANTLFVFVHGFLSDSTSCWQHSNGSYWPELVANDDRYGDIAVFSASYYTTHSSLEYGIADCAGELISNLQSRPRDGKRAPIDFENIIFVCHSLGGIVIRYVVCNYLAKFADKSVGLVLMASPSIGSAHANIFSWVADVLGNRVGKQLRPMSALLVDLDRRFKGILQDAKGTICGVEAIETEFYGSWFFARILPMVVSWDSAARYFGHPQRIAGSNHSSIVKPDSFNHQSYKLLLEFFDKNFASKQSCSSLITSPVIVQRASVARVLFDAYDVTCGEYYYTRNVDDEIAASLNVYSIWVSGQTGAGKTCALKHHLVERGYSPIELSLSHLSGQLTREACIRELSDTCEQFGEPTIKSVNTIIGIANFLALRAQQSPIFLYLDEVPISCERATEVEVFIQFLEDLLILVKQQAGAGCAVVISSIARPALNGKSKLNEQLLNIDIPYWTIQELKGLYELIIGNLPGLRVQDKFVDVLLTASNGSPRFLKTFLRNRAVAGNAVNDEFVLQRTIDQFDWRK